MILRTAVAQLCICAVAVRLLLPTSGILRRCVVPLKEVRSDLTEIHMLAWNFAVRVCAEEPFSHEIAHVTILLPKGRNLTLHYTLCYSNAHVMMLRP